MLFNKSKEVKLFAPANGKMIHIEDVEDAVFSGKLLGEGFAVVPSEGEVYAPVDGEIVVLQESKHAIGIKVNEKVEILIHIGIDTVNLNGKGFTSYVKIGDHVKAGEKLIDFDFSMVKTAGYKSDVIVIVIDHPDITKVSIMDNPDAVIRQSVHATIQC